MNKKQAQKEIKKNGVRVSDIMETLELVRDNAPLDERSTTNHDLTKRDIFEMMWHCFCRHDIRKVIKNPATGLGAALTTLLMEFGQYYEQ
jgi:mRNA-degrading endonuclease YafQ of YafQ-DinJ toxin-antitoxin module